MGQTILHRATLGSWPRRNGAGLVISRQLLPLGGQPDLSGRHRGRSTGAGAALLRPVERAAREAFRGAEATEGRVASGLGAVMNPANPVRPVDPDLIPPPNYAAYREFIAGLRSGKLDDLDVEFRHYRQAIALDSSFIAPLVQLAYRATWNDQCPLTDSIANALEPRREHLTAWDRLTHRLAPRQMPRRHAGRDDPDWANGMRRIPRSLTAKRQYSAPCNTPINRGPPNKSRRRLDPELDPPGKVEPRAGPSGPLVVDGRFPAHAGSLPRRG